MCTALLLLQLVEDSRRLRKERECIAANALVSLGIQTVPTQASEKGICF